MQIVSYRIKKPDILLKIRKARFWVSDNQHLTFARAQLLSGYIYENKNSKVIGIKYDVVIVVCPTWYILLFIGLFLTPFHILISLCKWRLFLPFLMYFWECLVRSSLSEQSSYAIDTWMCFTVCTGTTLLYPWPTYSLQLSTSLFTPLCKHCWY